MSVELLKYKIILLSLLFCGLNWTALFANIQPVKPITSIDQIAASEAYDEAIISVVPKKPRSTHKKRRKKQRKHRQAEPTQRLWGVWSLILGGYCLIFFIFSAIRFIGITFYWYLFALLLLGAILGVLLVISGVSNIDQSYIIYSDNADLRIERLRPQMWRDFIFAGIFILTIIPLLLLQFYLTASLVLALVLALLILALLKLGEIKRLKN